MFESLINSLSGLFTWIVVVAPWEQGLRVRLGKHVTKLEAGVYVRLPFVDRVYRQSTRRRLNTLRPQTLTTKDEKIVTCSGSIGYEVVDLEKLYETIEAPNDTISSEVAGIVAEYIGSRDLKDCSSLELEEYVTERVDLTRYGLGGKEYYVLSFAATRTYRFITGDINDWGTDGQLEMNQCSSEQE